MTVSAMDAAHFLCKLSGWRLSNLQVQKILYMADMNFAGQKGERLIDEDFQAWEYGPVLESVYHKLKAFGRKPVPDVFWGVQDISGTSESKMLELAYKNLKNRKPHQLVASTHTSIGAWIKNYVASARQISISTEDMIEEYNARRRQRN